MRYRMFDMFMSEFHPTEADTVLDVGVTDEGESVSESCNYFEARYPHKYRITGLGLEDASHLVRLYPGFTFVPGSALELPFEDRAFDYVHSAAVLEHVGSDRNQARMVAECLRVARKGIFLTTPNRWFPIEIHTVIPLLHWLPKNLHRKLLRAAGLTFWADESNLNLMSRRQLLAAAAGSPRWNAHVLAPRLFGWPSNLILIAHHSRM
jgi:methyltransferase family protein